MVTYHSSKAPASFEKLSRDKKPTSELGDTIIVAPIVVVGVTMYQWWFPYPFRYTDPDTNTKPSDIIYTRQGVPNGALFHTDRPDAQVSHFYSDLLNSFAIYSFPTYVTLLLYVTKLSFLLIWSINLYINKYLNSRMSSLFFECIVYIPFISCC